MKLKIFVEELEKNKSLILAHWLKNDDMMFLLNKYNISNDFFIKEYALHILNHYIDVAKGNKKSGDCPTIDKLLAILKHNNFQVGELFLFCSGFKNALIYICYELNEPSYELIKEITDLFEKNFSAVLQSYVNTDNGNRLLTLAERYLILSSTNCEGIITSVSQAFCDICGYSHEELIGQPHSIVRHPDTSDVYFEDMWETIQNGMTWRGEFKNLKKDGSHYWVSVAVEPRYDEQQHIIGYDAVTQDITLKKEMEEQEAILVEQSKSAAMGEMIPMIAHQWRQPLQTVSVLVQKLPFTKMINGELSDEVVEKIVSDVETQLNYMSKTIDDFRHFFKPDKTKEEIFMADLIKRTIGFLEHMLKVDNIELEINAISDLKLSLHSNEVIQVLINIIKNARDAMIEKKIKNRKIILTHSYNSTHAIIEIQDNAGGVKEKIIKKIFEPYFSTKTAKNGTGLGLYMCKKIIEQHCKGVISVKNLNDGVSFKIELPLH